MKTSRRKFIATSLLSTVGLPPLLQSALAGTDVNDAASPVHFRPADDTFTISVFSKNLQWLDYAAMASLAADIGFQGIDLTVRPQGHVLPERVHEDLPRAVHAIRKAGLNVYMITTAITSADERYAETILKTAGALGIRHYRLGWINYNDALSIEKNLEDIEQRLAKLAALNKQHNVIGNYQNHSGMFFGAPVWDLHDVLKKINSPFLASQYDIYHANVESANAWPIGLKLLHPFIKTIDIKDYQWTKKDKWSTESVPLGKGAIDFQRYVALLKQYNIKVPISMHFEYSLGGAEHGATTLSAPKEVVIDAMRKDLQILKGLLGA